MIDPKDHKKALKEKGIDIDADPKRSGRLTIPGTFLMAVCGWEFYNSSSKGTPGLMLRVVVVEGPQSGEILDVDLWFSGSMSSLCEFLLSHGHEEPFDPEDKKKMDDLFARVTQDRLFKGVCKEEHSEWNGKTQTKIILRYWYKAKTAPTKEQNEIRNKGMDSWDAYCRWRASNPRPVAGGSRPAQAQAQSQNQRSAPADDARWAPPPDEQPYGSDEDIPF